MKKDNGKLITEFNSRPAPPGSAAIFPPPQMLLLGRDIVCTPDTRNETWSYLTWAP